jgi:riboflavin kinase / FMN adenylyltransferase
MATAAVPLWIFGIFISMRLGDRNVNIEPNFKLFSIFAPNTLTVRVFQDFHHLINIPNPVLTIGTFDGVHLGHQKIIDTLNKEAEIVGGESVLFTFYPHPRMVLFPDSHGLKLIQTQAEKVDKLKRFGLQNMIVHPFTKEFSRLTATEFVRDFLVNKINVKTIVIGYDHQFGKNREGTLDLLKELAPIYDFNVVEIPAQDIDDVNVSSTKIRNALNQGDIKTAHTFLGEPFELNGRVVSGKAMGRTLGFPTANIDLESDLKLIPRCGVYLVQVVLHNGNRHFGMMNIGTNPTLADDNSISLEVFIFDFNQDIYNDLIQIKVLDRLRDETKFMDLNQLQLQLQKDEKMARNMLVGWD